jgi:hypothetical protein
MEPLLAAIKSRPAAIDKPPTRPSNKGNAIEK